MGKEQYRSRITVAGMDRAPHRAFMRASGLDEDDLDRPRIGICSTQGDNTPCSMSLAPQADAARLGVASGGGVPISFSTISVSDGVSMNHKGMRLSLISREIIADSIEAVMRAHAYDALVGFAGSTRPSRPC
jgi:dihydroxy-acid dehydratase